ncbi:MAG: hypothetical protein O7C59_00820 [Rickettsia endosymbiont of Ixodes persulcatus]|nr:hypothetical protein [Rickettsia endosymbiont of Ixodes persulcatus]MCZ6902576.1 hypothetical protein [Rickettsia endosymbiont of Ixodes persulcatus]MCZ6903913.1 hypothetical protein [Rickettsia endosymbiont of Ixodes persulcatus]MCZ6908406.1 hypothetical protein [Rickettsia endosymbiont of Ixodes persulcatus]MCZ6910960.1 hypothetical protein [Rickettsia endosymbiont of Ixodes persulcatus]
MYDSGEFILSEAKELPWSEMKEIAKDSYEEWFNLLGFNSPKLCFVI